MKRQLFLFLGLLAGLQIASLHAASAATTRIAGIARNGSQGNMPLAGAVVQLVQPKDGGKNKVLATTRTDATGHYAFSPRDFADNQLLMTNINHGGFDYWTVAYDGGNKLEQVGLKVNPGKTNLLVFDTTTQAIPLRFQVHHLAIEETPTGLKCIERIVVQNLTNRTLIGVGPKKISVLLNIPAIAKNVRLDPKITEAKLVKTDDGWGFVRPITPEAYGVRNAIIVNYDVDWESSLPWDKKVDLSREVAYPTNFFFVARLPKDKSLEVTAPLLGPDESQPLPIDGKTETRVVNSIGAPVMPQMGGGGGPVLEAGKTIQVIVARPVSPLFWGFAGLVVALCLFLPLAMLWPRGKGRGEKIAEPAYGGFVRSQTSLPGGVPVLLNGSNANISLSSQAREIIGRIAELDDLHEAGKIDEEQYQEQRAAWKNQLIESLATPSI